MAYIPEDNDIDESSRYLYSVEAMDDRGFWKAIDAFTGPSAEAKAKELCNNWIKMGWPKDKITINVSEFVRKKGFNINKD